MCETERCEMWAWQLSGYDDRVHAFLAAGGFDHFREAACTHSVPLDKITRGTPGRGASRACSSSASIWPSITGWAPAADLSTGFIHRLWMELCTACGDRRVAELDARAPAMRRSPSRDLVVHSDRWVRCQPWLRM